MLALTAHMLRIRLAGVVFLVGVIIADPLFFNGYQQFIRRGLWHPAARLHRPCASWPAKLLRAGGWTAVLLRARRWTPVLLGTGSRAAILLRARRRAAILLGTGRWTPVLLRARRRAAILLLRSASWPVRGLLNCRTTRKVPLNRRGFLSLFLCLFFNLGRFRNRLRLHFRCFHNRLCRFFSRFLNRLGFNHNRGFLFDLGCHRGCFRLGRRGALHLFCRSIQDGLLIIIRHCPCLGL